MVDIILLVDIKMPKKMFDDPTTKIPKPNKRAFFLRGPAFIWKVGNGSIFFRLNKYANLDHHKISQYITFSSMD